MIQKENIMKIIKLNSFLLFLGLVLGIGVFGTAQNVNAQNKDDKKVEKHDKDDDDGDDIYDSPEMQKKLAKEAKISKADAEKIALKRVPGRVMESELDKEKGKVVWEFEIKTAEEKVFEVAVDAKTGEIVLVKDETDENDDDGDTDNTQASVKKEGKRYKFWQKIPGLKKL
jgi:uncharacterized membrane protein YkoI